MNSELPQGAISTNYHVYERGSWTNVDSAIVDEVSLCIHVNGRELVTYQCSPRDQEAMAIGFLRAEGFIDGLEDIDLIEMSHSGTCVDVWLHKEVQMPGRTIKTSGCSGGITFDDLTRQRTPVSAATTIDPEALIARYQELLAAGNIYAITRGIHTSALCSPERVLLVAEDVGRHNTLDKLWGKAMLQGVDTHGRIILTTGRISSEMLGKAAKMETPIVASRTSPTSRSVMLAQAWNITVLGYVRRAGLRVYSAPERLLQAEPSRLSLQLPSTANLE